MDTDMTQMCRCLLTPRDGVLKLHCMKAAGGLWVCKSLAQGLSGGADLDLGRPPKVLVVTEEPGLHQPPGTLVRCGHGLHVSEP